GRVSALQPARRPATPPIRPAIACVSLAYRLPGWWQAAIATPTPGSGARPDGNRPPALAVLHGLPAPPAVLAAGLHRAGIGPAAPADSLDGPAPRCGPAVAATVVAMWPRLGWRQPGSRRWRPSARPLTVAYAPGPARRRACARPGCRR